MSFRYTNNLVATLKHRLYLEATHRRLVRQTFTGVCNGVEVTCSGYGSVVGIRMVDRAVWEPQYHVADSDPAASASPAAEGAAKSASNNGGAAAAAAASRKGIDLVKLSASIQAATWQAVHKLRSAKEEAHGQSLRHNPQLRASGSLRDWYEQDATTLHPRPYDGVKNLCATEWMQAVRFGLPQPARFLKNHNATPTDTTAVAGSVTVLSEADCDATNIPIGSAHPLFTPGLLQLELDPALQVTAGGGSRADAAYVLSEQKKVLRVNEEAFWERVELIRRSQVAAIPNGVKRNYAEMSSALRDNTEEKVQLRFTQ